VRDFVAKNRNHLGLRLDDTNFVCETGHLYLLESAVTFGLHRWAQELTKSMFEHAFLAEADSVSNVGRVSNLFEQMLIPNTKLGPDSQEVLSLLSWLHRELPQYQQSLGTLRPWHLLLALAAAADLKGIVTSEIESYLSSHFKSPIDFALILQMVTTGKRLSSSSASRESMVKLLLGRLGNIEAHPPVLFRATESEDFANNNIGTPLAWILRHVPHKHISRDEALSLASLLLENGAYPDNLAIPDAILPKRRTILLDCILHYDVEAVKLLLLYEADLSVINLHVAAALRITEQIRQETAMSTLLQENGISLHDTWPDISLNEFALIHTVPLGMFAMPSLASTIFRTGEVALREAKRPTRKGWLA
jgi:hypothetical protein